MTAFLAIAKDVRVQLHIVESSRCALEKRPDSGVPANFAPGYTVQAQTYRKDRTQVIVIVTCHGKNKTTIGVTTGIHGGFDRR